MVAMHTYEQDQAALKDMRILIVEDMGIVANELKWMLQELGCTIVAIAARIDDALAIISDQQLDGVLLDLRLAGQEAYPVAEVLTERDVPFIIMSGYDAGHIRTDFQHRALLQKPFDLDEMATAMVEAFSDAHDRTD